MDHKNGIPKFRISDANGICKDVCDITHKPHQTRQASENNLRHLQPNGVSPKQTPIEVSKSPSRSNQETSVSHKTNVTNLTLSTQSSSLSRNRPRRLSTSSAISSKSSQGNKNVDVCKLGERLAYDARFESLYRRVGTTADERRHIWMIHADLEREQKRQLRGIQRDVHLNDTNVRRQAAAILQRQERLKEEQKWLEQETRKRHALLKSLQDSHVRSKSNGDIT